MGEVIDRSCAMCGGSMDDRARHARYCSRACQVNALRSSTCAVGVCGFGRCGSTMVMAMLDAGGLPPVEGSQPVSYELEDLRAFHRLAPSQLEGRSVKLLDQAIRGVPPATLWRDVWLDRNPVEQARSAVKFLGGIVDVSLGTDAVEALATSYSRDRPTILGKLRRWGPVLVLRYENVLANPRKAAKQLRQVWPTLDVHAAAAAVHDRDGACRPDLAFEASPEATT